MTTSLTLFSSGIGVFEKRFDLEGKKHVSLSIPKNALPTALQTLSWENVELTNLNYPLQTKASVEIDADNALRSIAKNFRGADITLTDKSGREYKGRLVGYDEQTQNAGTYSYEQVYLVVMADKGMIWRCKTEDVHGITFNDSKIKDEFNKGLKSSLEKLKSESTTVSFDLQGSSNAIIRYGVPLASPTPSVRIRQIGKKFFLDLLSAIKNPTDEAWENINLTVVTGSPLAIKTDICDSSMPSLETVKIVATKGQVAPQSFGMTGGQHKSAKMRRCATDEFVATEAACETHAEEVGDFSVYTPKNKITVDRQSGTLVLLCSQEMSDVGLVLLYNPETHPTRAFRTIKAANPCPYSIGRANYAVYQDGVLAGEAVIDGVRSGETMMIPHALDSGVHVKQETGSVQKIRNRIEIAAGFFTEEIAEEATTSYRLTNLKNEDFNVVIDHPSQIAGSKIIPDGGEIIDSTKNTTRVSIPLKSPKSKGGYQIHKITERKVIKTKNEVGLSWIKNIIESDHPLKTNEAFRDIVNLQEQIEKIDNEIAEANESLQAQSQRLVNLRENIKVGGHDSDMSSWRSALSDCDKSMTNISCSKIPSLNTKKKEYQTNLRKMMRNLTISWSK